MRNKTKLKQKLPKELISELIQFIPFNIKWSKIRISKLFDIFVIKYQRKWILSLILLRQKIITLIHDIISNMKILQKPELRFKKYEMIGVSGLFDNRFSGFSGLTFIPSIAKDITLKVSQVDYWPPRGKNEDSFAQLGQYFETKKRILVELFEFLLLKINKLNISELEMLEDYLPVGLGSIKSIVKEYQDAA
uniref:Uncharacterized protein n=1 Tax=Meloidogyne enterolobii TaxID=390850 RepID=A0A6V7WKE5_MELEN|nr:unnamed protein product [Meloidogyne enterolobii]